MPFYEYLIVEKSFQSPKGEVSVQFQLCVLEYSQILGYEIWTYKILLGSTIDKVGKEYVTNLRVTRYCQNMEPLQLPSQGHWRSYSSIRQYGFICMNLMEDNIKMEFRHLWY
jgi:hypothetical protein